MLNKSTRSILFLAFIALLIGLMTIPALGANDTVVGDAPTGLPQESRVAPLLLVDSAQAIPNQYIVVLHKETGRRALNSVLNLAETNGGTTLHVYSNALNGFAANLPAKALAAIRSNPNVAYVEVDQIVSVDVTWGLDRVDQRNLPLDNYYGPSSNGAGVHTYIIDTGIRSTHNEFSGRVGSGYDAVDGGTPDDCNGHGTHVAGTVAGTTYGVAPGATIHGVRVLDCNGSGTNSDVIAGIDWVTNNHVSPAVANMSLGGGASTALDNAVVNSINSGVTYAVAAGNENTDACTKSPARVDAALTVGATTSSDARSSFSNYGTCVDIFAPGSSITSAWYTSNSATNTINGTSMASPHVAGAAALYLADNPNASPATVFNALRNNATSGVLSGIGSGSPNLLLYVGGTGGGNPTPTPTPPPSNDPCTNCDHYTGSLSYSGDSDYQPNGTYYYSGSGVHQGWLSGPSSADFDLELQKWIGGRWRTVASSTSYTSEEQISYSGSSGYYVWRVVSYSGSGSYDFWLDRP